MLQEKNALLSEQFGIGNLPRFDYDLATRQLVFSENGRPKVIAEVQIVGTTSVGAGNWLWAWANSHWPLDCVEDSERVCSFGEEHGIDELTNGYVEDDDLNALGWELTAVGARVCDAAGAYRTPNEDGALFFLYRNVRWAT